MQMSIYYQEDDEYLIDLVEKRANRKRMSKSAMILSILEEYFEAEKRIGEILRDMQAVEEEQVEKALNVQREKDDKRLGKIMVERDYVEKDQLTRALQAQKK
jgi:histidinol phosphatase-like enzyme